MIHPHHLAVHHPQRYLRRKRRSLSVPGPDHVIVTHLSITREGDRPHPRRTGAERKAPSVRSSVADRGHVNARSGERATSISGSYRNVQVLMRQMNKLTACWALFSHQKRGSFFGDVSALSSKQKVWFAYFYNFRVAFQNEFILNLREKFREKT